MEKTIHSRAYHCLLEWLKAERTRQRLTTRAMTARIDVAYTWVTKVENHERRLDVAEYVRYCRALKINPCKGIAILERELRLEEQAGVRR